MKRIACTVVIALAIFMAVAPLALATWPSGSQGDQYTEVNNAMDAAAANAGISPDTFIDIYNNAIVGGVSGYSGSQLDAACSVMGSLSAYKTTLTDYDTVYNNLGCGSRLAAGTTTRGALPSTGVAAILLVGLGFGAAGASFILKKKQ